MFGFGKNVARDRRVDRRIAQVRAGRAAQGHALTTLQVGMVGYLASIDPKYDADSRAALQRIADALRDNGHWQDFEEWRISTSFDQNVETVIANGKTLYQASVECDGQRFSCRCPTIENAYGFLQLYKRIIMDQFYSIGPPWADMRLFEP